jgi:amidase
MYQSATHLAQQIRTGQCTSTEITREHLAQIKKHNPALNAVVILLEAQALKDAAECDHEAQQGHFRGPLHGVPMTVKEAFWIKGTPSTVNSKRNKDWIAPDDGLAVKRLKRAGAVIMGKTNVPLNLVDYQTAGELYPEGKNPYDTERTPGGSSGGSAAALASGMTPIELGGDLGGSVRVPAHFCGVYGLKPTENTVPTQGMGPLPNDSKGYISHLASAGPLARTLEDLELVWQIIRGSDENERSVPRIEWHDPAGKSLSDYRIAWVDAWPDFEPSIETRSVIRNFVDGLTERGAQADHAAPEGDLHSRTLALFVRLFPQVVFQGVPAFFLPLLKMQMQRGLLSGFGKYQREFDQGIKLGYNNYIETMTMRHALTGEWERFFDRYDVLVCPMSFGPAFKRCKIGTPIPAGAQTMPYNNYVWPYVACFNASGHPAMNIPLGLGHDGLPIGVQIVGPYWSEPDLLQFARLISTFAPGFVAPQGA